MNPYDVAALTDLDGLGGFFSKIFKKIKNVVKKVVSPINNLRKKVQGELNNVYRKVVPKFIRNVGYKLEDEANNLVRNKIFRNVVKIVASIYGMGNMASAAYAAIDVYDMKKAKGEQPTKEETKAFYDSIEWMLQLNFADLKRVIATLSPPMQKEILDYYAKNKNVQQQLAPTNEIQQSAFIAGFEVGQIPEIKIVTQQLLNQGLTISQVGATFKQSEVYKQTTPLVIKEIVGDGIAAEIKASPLPINTTTAAVKASDDIIKKAITEETSNNLLPLALAASVLLL